MFDKNGIKTSSAEKIRGQSPLNTVLPLPHGPYGIVYHNVFLSLQNGTSVSISQSETVQSGSDLGQSFGSEGQSFQRPVPPRLKGDIYSFKKQEESVETADVKVDRIFQIIIPSLIAGKVTTISSFWQCHIVKK